MTLSRCIRLLSREWLWACWPLTAGTPAGETGPGWRFLCLSLQILVFVSRMDFFFKSKQTVYLPFVERINQCGTGGKSGHFPKPHFLPPVTHSFFATN